MPLLPRSQHSPPPVCQCVYLSACLCECLCCLCACVCRIVIVWLAWICRCVRVCLCLFPEGERPGFCDATAGYSRTSLTTAGQSGKAKQNRVHDDLHSFLPIYSTPPAQHSTPLVSNSTLTQSHQTDVRLIACHSFHVLNIHPPTISLSIWLSIRMSVCLCACLCCLSACMCRIAIVWLAWFCVRARVSVSVSVLKVSGQTSPIRRRLERCWGF
jgi:hypothetical protein